VVDAYYASEIDKYAIGVAKRNHPEIVELGNIENWMEWNLDFASIDLVIGGSPCQGFTFAGKKLNFDDDRSKLFFVFVDILNHIRRLNPQVKFMLENVKMKAEWKGIIDKCMGVNGIKINSNLFSAQNRDRVYWTNILIEGLPKDNAVVLSDILINDYDREKKLYLSEPHHKAFLKSYYWKPCMRGGKSKPLLATYYKQPPHCPYIAHRQEVDNNRFSAYRRLHPVECERLQCLPDDYTLLDDNGKELSWTQRYKMIGNGWTVGVIKHIFRGLN
jgi:site-specific DNA-cytosine methylase